MYTHDALIRRWLDGEIVQYLDGDLWVDLVRPDSADKLPHFYPDDKYRIKPVELRYRVALLRDGSVAAVNTLQRERMLTDSRKVAHWLTEWVEVVVPSVT